MKRAPEKFPNRTPMIGKRLTGANRASQAPLPRMPSKNRELFEDPLQFLWAVSYSDLLMVLMSFFIIFFEANDTGDSVIQRARFAFHDQIKAESTAGGTGSGTGLGIGTGGTQGTGDGPVMDHDVVAAVAKSLAINNKELPLMMKTNPSAIVIDFPENFFPPGEYAIPKDAVASMKKALDALRPFEKDIQLTWIGHSDAVPLRADKPRSKVIDSNLVLSNLRATRAVELTLAAGFDPKFITAQGAGEYSRNTRSISLKISERRTQP